jgi:hypothetical protein
MGYDATCTLKIDGRSSKGKAWLEQKDLVFRGEDRLSIPLATITSAIARNGSLLVRFGERHAEFQIGDVAEKWARRITNPPSRLEKLGLKEGMTIAAVRIEDPVFLDEVRARSVTVTNSLRGTTRRFDAVFYGADHRDALERLKAVAKLIKVNGAVWVVRPKGRKEITEAETMAAGKRAGLVDVKVVSFSDTHTAEKFVIPVASRPTA